MTIIINIILCIINGILLYRNFIYYRLNNIDKNNQTHNSCVGCQYLDMDKFGCPYCTENNEDICIYRFSLWKEKTE